jgi:predicted dehydrogenase
MIVRPDPGPQLSQEPVRIGVIGAGFIAQVAHLYALSQIPQASIVALSESDDDLRAAAARVFGIPSVVCDYQDLLHRSDIDALLICVPRKAQSLVTKEALSGSRAVLSEKPMAMTLDEATRMVSLARHSGASWSVGYMRRYDAGVRRFGDLFKGMRENGKLGAVVDVHMHDFCGTYSVAVPPHARRRGPRHIRYPEASDELEFVPADLRKQYDYTLNVASHDINLMRFFFGDDIRPSRFSIAPNKAQHMTFEAQGFLISLVVAPVDIGRWDQRLEVTFERGKLGLVMPSPLARQESATIVLERPGNTEMITIPASEHVWSFEAQARAFVESARQGTEMVTSGAACLGDMAMIDSFWKQVELL